MIVACPSCQARFNLDPTKLGPEGRRVRCSKCGDSWHQGGPEPEPEIEQPVQIDPDEARALFGLAPASAGGDRASADDSLFDKLSPTGPAAEQASPAPAKAAAKTTADRPRVVRLAAGQGSAAQAVKQRAASPVTWAGLVVVLLALALVALEGRPWIVQKVPAAADLYRQIGLGERPGAGLALAQLDAERLLLEGSESLMIRGKIINQTDQERPVPLLAVRLSDGAGVATSVSAVEPDAASLPPGGETGFTVTLADPPPKGEIALEFVERR